MNFKFLYLAAAAAVLFAGSEAFAQGGVEYWENYEDYLEYRAAKNANAGRDAREAPLSDMEGKGRGNIYNNLRGYIRDEIDQTIAERRHARGELNNDRLSQEIRTIVREEIRDVANIKRKKYLDRWTVEFGGMFAFGVNFVKDDKKIYNTTKEMETNLFGKASPFVNLFFFKYFALSAKFDFDFNFKTAEGAGAVVCNANLGPMFAVGLNKPDTIIFYIAVYGGICSDTNLSTKSYVGFRYSNDVGLKFQLTPGVMLNVGINVAVNIRETDFSFFDTNVVPYVGVSAWL